MFVGLRLIEVNKPELRPAICMAIGAPFENAVKTALLVRSPMLIRAQLLTSA